MRSDPRPASTNSAKRFVLLIDHGSRSDEANQVLDQLAELVRGMTDLPVKTAHLQWAEPTIAEGVKACVEDGAEEIVAVPVLLSPGKHSTSDIPQQLKSAATHCPGVRCRLTPPLGPDPRIAQVILERIEEGGALEDC